MLIQLHVEKQPRQKSHTNLGPTLAVKGQSMKWRAEVCADKVQMVGSQQFGRTRGTVEMYDGHGRTDDVRCDLWSHSGLNSDSVCCWEGAPGLVCRTWPADGARSNQRSKKKGSYCHMWRMQTGSVLHQTDEKTTWRQRGILRHWGQVADAEKNKTKLNVIGERSDSEGSGAAATDDVALRSGNVKKSVESFADSAPIFWTEVHSVYPSWYVFILQHQFCYFPDFRCCKGWLKIRTVYLFCFFTLGINVHPPRPPT